MTKKSRFLMVMLILGLPASMLAAKTPHELTREDCLLIFPGANSCEKIKEIEPGLLSSEVWCNGSWETTDEFLGYAFLKSVTHDGRTIHILVGMTRAGVISGVRVKGIDGVDEEFLAQFRGKTGKNSFDIARTAEELLFIPAMIKAMQGNFALSESIAQGVKEVVNLAPQLISK